MLLASPGMVPLDILFFGLAIMTTFGLAGGTRKTQAEVAEEYLSAMKLAMLKVLLADGEVRDEELSVARDVYCRMSGLEITEEEIIEWCRGKMAGYRLPRSVDFVSEFPKTPTGKIKKKVLRETYWKDQDRKI
jgi:acyl-CoA synthetase (AMP-forming)/AMP-acid ligase II